MATNAFTHPEDGMVYACPYCDAASIHQRTQKNCSYDPECGFACYSCNQGVSEPVEREAKPNTGGGRCAKHGIAAKLEGMDPEDVPALAK